MPESALEFCALSRGDSNAELKEVRMDGKRKMRASTNGSYNDYIDDYDEVCNHLIDTSRPPGVMFWQSNPCTHTRPQAVAEGSMVRFNLTQTKALLATAWSKAKEVTCPCRCMSPREHQQGGGLV